MKKKDKQTYKRWDILWQFEIKTDRSTNHFTLEMPYKGILAQVLEGI